MTTFKLVEQDFEMSPEDLDPNLSGDFTLGNPVVYTRFLFQFIASEFNGRKIVPLWNFSYNHWNALYKIGVDPADIDRLYDAVEYGDCFYPANEDNEDLMRARRPGAFNCLLPLAVIPAGERPYFFRDGQVNHHLFYYKFDEVEHVIRNHDPEVKLDYFMNMGGGSIARARLGHGFTDTTLPSDGGTDVELFFMRGENGDIIVCVAHVWFNK